MTTEYETTLVDNVNERGFCYKTTVTEAFLELAKTNSKNIDGNELSCLDVWAVGWLDSMGLPKKERNYFMFSDYDYSLPWRQRTPKTMCVIAVDTKRKGKT